MSTDALPLGGLPPRPADRLLPGAGLALVVHAGLVVALALGVDWRRHSDAVHSAELWSALPQLAAPRAAQPEPAPRPPPPAAAPAPPPEPTRSEAQIAIEKEKLARAEREARLARQREDEARRARDAEEAALKQQRELQRKRQDELARQTALEQARLDKQRQENLDRMLAQAGGTGAPNSSGTAARDSAPSQAYAGRLIAHILANVVMPDIDRLPKTLEAVVEVRATTSGTVLSRRLVRPSGNTDWDQAVLRAIDRSGTLPRDTDGRVPTSIEITFRPPQ